MVVHCTVYLLNIIMMINQEKVRGGGGVSLSIIETEGNICYLNHVNELQGEDGNY